MLLSETAGRFSRARHHAHPAEVSRQSHGLKVVGSLHARPDEGEIPGILSRKEPGGHRRYRRSPDPCERRRVHHRPDFAGLGAQEQHRPLVRIDAALPVAGEHTDDFDAQRRRLTAQICRHESQQARGLFGSHHRA